MRSLSRIGVALLLAIGGLVAAVAPVEAVEGEKLTIRIDNDDKVAKSYDRMLVNDASSEFSGDPETCAEVPFCTLVPLEVLLRDDYDPDINEFVLTVRLGWDDRGVNVQGNAAQGNDLDMYIFKAKQEKNAKGTMAWVEVGRSAGSRQPEVAKIFTPDEKDYLIVVYNWVGVNTGFELAASYRDASIEELGDFEGAAATRPGSSSSSGLEADSGSEAEDFPPATPARPVFSSPSRLPAAPDSFSATGSSGPGIIVPAPIGADDGSVFDLPAGSSRDLTTDLAANETQDVFKPRVANLNPEDASPALLVFWLVVVPLVLAGAAALFMLRRRPAALTLQLPRTSTA